jgi:hypothetical protein
VKPAGDLEKPKKKNVANCSNQVNDSLDRFRPVF